MDHPFALVALAWLATYLLHSTLFLGGAWILDRRLVRERSREILWKSALLAGVLTSGLQAGFGLDPFGGRIPIVPASLSAAPLETLPVHEPTFEDAAFLMASLPEFDAAEAPMEFNVVARGGSIEAQELGPVPFSARLGNLWDRARGAWPTSDAWQRYALFGWIGGAGLLACITFLARRRLAYTLAGARRIDDGALPGLLALLRRRSGIRRPVALFVAPRLGTPIATGVLFPRIYVPPRALSELKRPQQEAMLAHELAHIARLDPLWLGLGRGIATLFFLQPLNRVARRRLARTSEFLCDAWAVEHTHAPLALARCLSEVAHWLHGRSAASYACGMAGLRSPLGERVERLVEGELEPGQHRWGLAPLGAFLLGTGAFLVPGFAAPDRGPAPEPNPEPTTLVTEYAEPEYAGPLSGFALDLTQLRSELLGLELELLKLRRDGVTPQQRDHLTQIEQRLRELLTRRDRIENLLERANALLADTAPSSGNPHEE